MSTIQIKAQVTDQDLLKAVEQLDSQELQQFVGQVLALRARRNTNPLPAKETDLLLKINEGLPEKLLNRYVPLQAKRDENNLTPEEHAELLHLSEEVERHEADRVAALADLAALRKTTLAALMTDLGIRGPQHAG